MATHQQFLPLGYSTRHVVDTLWALVGRELRIRYKGSFFGIVWAVLSPLGTVAILHFVFTRILSIAIPNFSSYLYAGLLPWIWMQAAVQTGASTLNDNSDLVRTPFFAKPLLPAAITCTNFLFYLLALPVLLGMILFEGLPLTRALLALPVIWIVQGILTLAFTVLIAAIGVLIRDVQHLMGVVLMFWFYLTPVFYDLKQIPPGAARWFSLNPMTAIVAAHRTVTLYGQLPDWNALGRVALIGVVLLGFSLALFRTLEDAFVEEA
jgi:lipopolysaccharide transport system permease protein